MLFLLKSYLNLTEGYKKSNCMKSKGCIFHRFENYYDSKQTNTSVDGISNFESTKRYVFQKNLVLSHHYSFRSIIKLTYFQPEFNT